MPFTPSRRLRSPLRKVLLAALALVVLTPASSQAFVLQEVGLSAAAAGLALGPDGNVWAAEEANASVVRVSSAGTVVGRIAVAGEPTSVAAGPGGRVWAALPESHELVWFDATAPAPSAHYVSTGPANCGPEAIADGGNGLMYFSMPTDGTCTSRIGHVNADGSGFGSTATEAGNSYDIEVSGGKLFSPDFSGDAIRRLALPLLNQEAALETPAGSGPNGITVDSAGNVWTTLYITGQLAYAPAGAVNGTKASVLTPTGGSLVEPFGIVEGADGKMYVPSVNSQLLAATTLPSFAFMPMPVGSEPWDVAKGANGDLWVTDVASTRLLHLSSPPAPAPVPVSGTTTSPPAPVAKVTAPALSLSGKSKQVLGNFVQLKASCAGGPCSLSASGALKLNPAGKGRTTQPKLKAVQNLKVAAGKQVVLKLKIPAKAKKQAAAVLAEKGGKASAKITVKGTGAGAPGPAVFKVTLKK